MIFNYITSHVRGLVPYAMFRQAYHAVAISLATRSCSHPLTASSGVRAGEDKEAFSVLTCCLAPGVLIKQLL